MMLAQKWDVCLIPRVGDILKWNEPLWAVPRKPRGKLDKVGEQEVTAELLVISDVYELKVISVQKLTTQDFVLRVKENDKIKRKASSIQKGNCYKLSGI